MAFRQDAKRSTQGCVSSLLAVENCECSLHPFTRKSVMGCKYFSKTRRIRPPLQGRNYSAQSEGDVPACTSRHFAAVRFTRRPFTHIG